MNGYVVFALIFVVWLAPPILSAMRGRATLGCISYIPLVGLLILPKVLREPATPDSWWADRFYGETAMQVSKERYPLTSLTGTRSEQKQYRQERKAARFGKPSMRQRYKAQKRQNKSKRRMQHRRTADMKEAKKKDREGPAE